MQWNEKMSVASTRAAEEAAAIVNEALLSFLQDWLDHHIPIEDMA